MSKAQVEAKKFSFSLKIKLWIASIAVLIGFCYYMLVDEALNPEITDILNEYNSKHSLHNNGSVYRLGMWSSFYADPYKVGLMRLKSYADAAKTQSGTIEYEDYPDDEWLVDIELDESLSPLFCRIQNEGCLDSIWDNTQDIEPLLKTYAGYLQRYETFMSFTSFELAGKPSFFEPKITATAGNDFSAFHLKLLSVIDKSAKGLRTQASKELAELIFFNLHLLEYEHQVIYKVFSIVNHQKLVQVASFLLLKTEDVDLKVWESVNNAFKKLSATQLSSKRQWLYEYVMFANSYAHLDNKFKRHLPSLLRQLRSLILYKPNKTLNSYFEHLNKHNNLISYENGLLVERQVEKPAEWPWSLRPNNILGSILISTALPGFLSLEADVHELDYLQNLYHLAFLSRSTGSAIELESTSLISPYTAEKPFVNGEQLCLAGIQGKEDLCIYFAD